MADSHLDKSPPVVPERFRLNRHEKIVDNLDQMLAILPQRIRDSLRQHSDTPELVEIVMDLGRCPEVRFRQEDAQLEPMEITAADLAYTVAKLGEFGRDNRAGIERTLHRISAMRNRTGDIVGLTCRVGRAVSGTIEIVRDPATREPFREACAYIVNRAREMGVLLSSDGPNHNVPKIKPPLVFGDEEVTRLAETLDTVLSETALNLKS